MKKIFLIGEVSKLFHIKVSTLRYYDEVHLFKPFHVDQGSNYRTYHISQFEKLNTIIYLKALGVSLNEIKATFESNTLEEVKVTLGGRLGAVQGKIKKLQAIEGHINRHLQEIEYGQGGCSQRVEFTYIPERTLVEFVTQKDTLEAYQGDLRVLELMAGDQGMVYTGRYGLGISHDRLVCGDYRNDRIFLFVDLQALDLEGWVTVEGGMYAIYRLEGQHKDAKAYYPMIIKAIREAGYDIIEDAYEVVIRNKKFASDKDILEIQMPIEKTIKL